MRIRSVRTHILRVKLGKDRFYSSQSVFPERNSLLVRVETEDGLVGWGEGGQYGPPEPVASCINDVFSPLIIGADASRIGVIWDLLYSRSRDFGQKGSYIEAISALDIALWDIQGKSLGVPIHQLLGGAFRESVAAYATGGYYSEDEYRSGKPDLKRLATQLQGFAALGFPAVKMKIGLLPVEHDARRIEAAREAVGPDMTILVDCNHAYNSTTAIRIGRTLERNRIGWMEEPVPPEDRDGYRRVRSQLSIPIAGGECEYTRFGFRDFIAGQCADIAQPDVCVCGGLSEFLKICGLASSYGIQTVPHVWGSGVAFHAALHAVAAIPPCPYTVSPVILQNEPMIEYDQSPNPLRDGLLRNSIKLEDNRIKIPTKPGLGIELDEDMIREYEGV